MFLTMRVSAALILSSLIGSASAFGIVTPRTQKNFSPLQALISADEASAETAKEISFVERWNEIKVIKPDDTEALSALSEEEKEAYDAYNQHIKEDIEKITSLAELFINDMAKKKEIQPKTKGQRKRDKWARVQALEAIRAEKK